MLPYLSLAIWVPIVAGLLVLAVNRDADAAAARWLALVGAVAGFAVTIPLYAHFRLGTAEMQFVEAVEWIPRFNVNYLLGVDGISMLFVLLNSFITVLVVWAGWVVIQTRVAQYMAAFLIMSGLINGVFAALDGVLFYVFFEAMLIPMYLIIGVWGGPNRVYAAIKFFLYTLLGSLLMLVAFIYLYSVSGGSFSILEWYQLPLSLKTQVLLFVAFFLSFAVKVPMWPVHTWLPDAHVEAPTGGSVVLAAITLKVGAYGFVRFILPILPDASHYLAGFVITLSLIAVVYIGFVALVQADMKKLIAYSSISHMGFVTLGFFLFSELGVEGGLVQMISHGFVSAAMFLCVGVLYDRMHSRQIADYGGVVNTMPQVRGVRDAVRDGQRRPSRHQRLRRRVHGDPRRGQGEFLARLPRRDHADPRRRLHAVDVQAGLVRRGRQRPRRRAHGPVAARVLAAGDAGRRGPGHGRLSEAVHRRDARLGHRPARARRQEQAVMTGTPVNFDFLPALPEIALLVAACVVLLVDLRSARNRGAAGATG